MVLCSKFGAGDDEEMRDSGGGGEMRESQDFDVSASRVSSSRANIKQISCFGAGTRL